MATITRYATSGDDWRLLEDCADLEPITISMLADDGYRRISVSQKSISRLAIEAAEACLDAWTGDRAKIHAFVFFTDAISDFAAAAGHESMLLHHAERKELFDGLVRLGVTFAYPAGAWLAGCSNALLALIEAQRLVDTHMADCVLVLGADRSPPGQTRVQGRPDLPFGIRSDVGVACLVERSGVGITLAHAALAANLHTMAAYERERHGEYLLGMAAALKQLRTRFDSRARVHAADYQVITSANYHAAAVGSYLMSCALAPDRACLPTKAEYGHSVCADVVLNVQRLLADHHRVLAFSPSAFGWMLAAFERSGQ